MRHAPLARDEALDRSRAARESLAQRQRRTEKRLDALIKEDAQDQRQQHWTAVERRFHERRGKK